MRSAKRFFLILALLVLPPSVRAQQQSLQGLDEYVQKAMADWEVPGLAIAVVKNDQVVLAKGYGVRKLGEPVPVTERTLFAIGSCSKAFTAALMAMLVDEGKIKWDDSATKYLPGFQLYDPYATRELMVRDLLTHRSGLERGDQLWYGSAYSREEILRRVRYLKPSWSFRSRYGYQNIMFLAAGQAIAGVSGKSWDDFLKERIFKPLGMNTSNTSVTAFRPGDDVATPHTRIEEKMQPISYRNIDNIAPAGAINSSVSEMAQWIRLQLGQGEYKGQRLYSSGAAREMHMPQTVVRLEGPTEKVHPESHLAAYGFGWIIQDYRGRKLIQHSGGIDGMISIVALVPEEKLGLVVLTNMSGNLLTTALMYRVVDAYLGAPPRDWSANLLKVFKEQQDQQKAEQKKREAERLKATLPSLPLEKYAGTYENDLYGQAKVTLEDGKLVLRLGPAFTGDLEHWHYDTFQATWRDRQLGKNPVAFTLNNQGKVEELKITAPGLTEYPFKRAAEAAPAKK